MGEELLDKEETEEDLFHKYREALTQYHVMVDHTSNPYLYLGNKSNRELLRNPYEISLLNVDKSESQVVDDKENKVTSLESDQEEREVQLRTQLFMLEMQQKQLEYLQMQTASGSVDQSLDPASFNTSLAQLATLFEQGEERNSHGQNALGYDMRTLNAKDVETLNPPKKKNAKKRKQCPVDINEDDNYTTCSSTSTNTSFCSLSSNLSLNSYSTHAYDKIGKSSIDISSTESCESSVLSYQSDSGMLFNSFNEDRAELPFEKILSVDELKRERPLNSNLSLGNNEKLETYKPFYKGMKLEIPFSGETKITEISPTSLDSISRAANDFNQNAMEFSESGKTKKKKLSASQKARR